MKQWLSLFLIILFSFQVLPVRELGRIIMKKSLTDQVQDETSNQSDVSKQSLEKEIDKIFVSTPQFRVNAIIVDEQVKVALHNLPLLEDYFHPDITVPPPDFTRS